MKFVSKEAQKAAFVAAFFNSTPLLGRVVVTLFRPRDFVQTASDKPFN